MSKVAKSKRVRPPELNRLPKRLLAYINELESALHGYERAADAEGESRIGVKTYSGKGEQLRYLPSDARIRFILGKQTNRLRETRHIEVHLAEYEKGQMRMEVYGSSALLLRGNSSNVFFLDVEDRF